MPATDSTFLTSFVHTLDRTERTMLMLHYVEHLSVDEIGHVLRVSSDEVASRLKSIRERTRAALADVRPAA